LGDRARAILTTEIGAIIERHREMKAKIIPLCDVSKIETSSSPPKKHLHSCPLCREMTMETDEVCGMSIDHVFACLPCLEVYRSRLE
jgi:hypothetical protein